VTECEASSFLPENPVTTLRLTRVLCALALATLPAVVLAQGRPRVEAVASMPAPQGVTAQSTPNGVQLSWQGVANAAQYVILRAPSVGAPGTAIGKTPPGTLSFVDQGFNAPAAYQVVAVMGNATQRSSAAVAYTPPPGGPQRIAVEDPRGRLAAPAISSVAALKNRTPAYFGDTLEVRGTAFTGVTGVRLQKGQAIGGWIANPGDGIPHPSTPFGLTPTSFRFVIPRLFERFSAPPTNYVVIVTKGSVADTSDSPILIADPDSIRKIISVAKLVVRAGQRIDVTGLGFDEVIGGYFGVSTPGSTMNPLMAVANRHTSDLQLMTPPDCNQEGILMLSQGRPGIANDLIIGDRPIIVACVKETPKGMIQGSEGNASGTVRVKAGGTFSIKGTGLKYVTRVRDGRNSTCPFTFLSAGVAGDFLTVTNQSAPPANLSCSGTFYLENSLTDPIVPGTVTGSVELMMPPTMIQVAPAWAEPAQTVTLAGSYFTYGAPPTVTVGGVPAQVVSATASLATIRLGSGTTAGPIELTNEVGKVTFIGPFTTNSGTSSPGFFVVAGPSVVQSVTAPRPTLAVGDTLVVKGQNLARLGGICVAGKMASLPYMGFKRPEGGSLQGDLATNSEMKVLLAAWDPAWIAKGSPVQLYAPTTPAGQFPAAYACVPNSTSVIWPAP
jgi:hypothetical protein